MLKGFVVALGIIVGLFFLAAAAVYLAVPADHLPKFIPGYDPDSNNIHLTHGLGMLAMALIGFAMSWLRAWGD